MPIRVHCWGGLGSQLFAYNLLLDISRRYPHRKSVLIIHSGGVTYREPEIQFLLEDHDFRFDDDFVPKSNPRTSKVRIRYTNRVRDFTKGLFQKFLVLSGFFGFCNTDLEFERMKPWVLSIRGHYTHRKVLPSNLEVIIRRAQAAGLESPKGPAQNKVIGVQYRLGDLLNISTKSPINAERIKERIQDIAKEYPDFKTEIYSDVNSTAKNLLGSFKNQEFVNAGAWNTICRLTCNHIFIGTNSKISEWVVIFRLSNNPKSLAFLPADFRLEVLKAISNPEECLNFYDL
jgi:hypothetical protein